MKGMGSKMKGLKMGFGKKRDKEDEPDKDKPDKTTGGIGSSAWRRRLEESAMQKLGLSKAEKDENTGDVDEELARFRATAADVAELLKRAEAYGNLTRSADEALLDLVACYDDAGAVDWGGSPPAGADDTKAVAEAVAGAKDRAVHGQLLKGWALGGLGSVLECARRIEDVAKHRHDLVMDYFARKRKLEAAEKAAGRAKDPHAKDDDVAAKRAKFDHSAFCVRTQTAYLAPLLEAFDDAASAAKAAALRGVGAASFVFHDARAGALRGWAARQEAGLARDHARLKAGELKGGLRPSAPPGDDFKKLSALLESPPRLPGFSAPDREATSSPSKKAGEVFGAPLGPAPAAALRALLERLRNGGLDREGVFRIPGNSETVDAAKRDFDAGGDPRAVADALDLDDAATLTKMWFRERDAPLVAEDLNRTLRGLSDDHADDGAFAAAAAAALGGPDLALTIFLELLHFLHDVQRRADVNMMTAENLAICFAPNVMLLDPEAPTAMLDLQPAIAITERLILVAPGKAGGRPPPPSPPAAPPSPKSSPKSSPEAARPRPPPAPPRPPPPISQRPAPPSRPSSVG